MRKNKNRGYQNLRVWQDAIAFRLENGLLKLVQTLEQKREKGEWVDTLQVREDMAIYECDEIG